MSPPSYAKVSNVKEVKFLDNKYPFGAYNWNVTESFAALDFCHLNSNVVETGDVIGIYMVPDDSRFTLESTVTVNGISFKYSSPLTTVTPSGTPIGVPTTGVTLTFPV